MLQDFFSWNLSSSSELYTNVADVINQIVCICFLFAVGIIFGLSRYLFLGVVYEITYCCWFFEVGLRDVTLLVPRYFKPNYLLLLFLCSWSLACKTTFSLAFQTKLATAVVLLQLVFALSRLNMPNSLLLFPLCSSVSLRVSHPSRTRNLSLYNSTAQANNATRVDLCWDRYRFYLIYSKTH